MVCFSAISFMVLFFQAFYPVDNLLEIKSGDSIVSSGLLIAKKKKSHPSQCFQFPALFFPSPHLTSITLLNFHVYWLAFLISFVSSPLFFHSKHIYTLVFHFLLNFIHFFLCPMHLPHFTLSNQDFFAFADCNID